MCIDNRIRELCLLYESELKMYVQRCVVPCIEKISTNLNDTSSPMSHTSLENESRMLHVWSSQYTKYKHVSRAFRDVFMYLDRTLSTPGVVDCTNELNFMTNNPLSNKCRHIFKDAVFEPHKQNISRCIVNIFNHLRFQCLGRGASCRRTAFELNFGIWNSLKTAIRPFYEVARSVDAANTDCGADYNTLQNAMVRGLRSFYTTERDTWVSRANVEQYVFFVENALEFERNGARACFLGETRVVLEESCRKVLLCSPDALRLLTGSSIVRNLLFAADERERQLMRRIFKLYEPLARELTELGKTFYACIVDNGIPTHPDARGDTNSQCHVLKTVKAYLTFKTIVGKSFDNHRVFASALRDAFRLIFIHDPKLLLPADLAELVHQALVRGGEHSGTKQVLEHLPDLYALLRDKDEFDNEYQKRFQCRLLENKMKSEALERSTIDALRAVAGCHWANNLCGMFEDYKESQRLCRDFSNGTPCRFQSTVGCTRHWPASASEFGTTIGMLEDDETLPPEVRSVRKQFDAYYEKKFPHRKLRWRMDMGSAVVSVQFRADKPRIHLAVSTMQMLILQCFSNGRVVVSFPILAHALGYKGARASETALRDPHVHDHILSLLHPNLGDMRVLQKNPRGRALSPADKFRLNSKFDANGMLRIKIPLRTGLMVRTQKDRIRDRQVLAENERIMKRRQIQADASIVRVLKHRCRVKHSHLVKEVTHNLRSRFLATPGFLKKRIECLIEQEYMKRDIHDRATYIYVN